jgi:hypothetical protein
MVRKKTPPPPSTKARKGSRQKRLPTDIVLLGELEEAIARLADSPRFDFLKNLIVAEFTAARKSPPLTGVTFGDLSDRLRDSKSLGEDIAMLTPEDHEQLLKTLSDLGAGPAAPLQPIPPPQETQRPSSQDGPRLSSVEAEQRLTAAITALRNAPDFHRIKLFRLGDFWDEGWPRAPFEEALTLQQITEMKVAVMLEKRSFNGVKILNVVHALERASASVTPSKHIDASTGLEEQARTNRQISVTPELTFADRTNTKLPAHAVAALRYLETLIATHGNSEHPLARLLANLPATVTAPEIAVAWFRQDSTNDVVATALQLAPVITKELFASANTKIAKVFHEVAPREHRSWLLALQGPGITLDHLLSPYPAEPLPLEVNSGLGRIVLSALGATHPTIFGHTCERYYTKTGEAAELVVRRLLNALPLPAQQVTDELAALLPFFDAAEIRSLIAQHATFNEREQVWLRK